jgi:hypothetical protein
MTTQEATPPVLGMFPFSSLLETDANPSRAFIVDVAGGTVGEWAKDKLTVAATSGSAFWGPSRLSAI